MSFTNKTVKNIQRCIKEDLELKIMEQTLPIEDRDMAQEKKSLHGKFIAGNKFLNNSFD